MPELPEVETTRRGISPYSEKQQIEKIVIRQRQLRWAVPAGLEKRCRGKTIQTIKRRAKYLLLELENGNIIIHLGMSGSLRIIDSKNSKQEPPGKHDHVDFLLANGKTLRFNDPRKFGCVLWQEKDESLSLLENMGPEPLTEAFNAEYLFKKSRKKTVAVKQFIMNNTVVVGVGNIYANESLFRAGVRPQKPAGKVTRKQYQQLVDEIKQVLSAAIEQGGTTLRDFVGGDGKPGYFQQTLLVYGRGGEDCKRCGSSLKEIRQGQRASTYCPNCQK